MKIGPENLIENEKVTQETKDDIFGNHQRIVQKVVELLIQEGGKVFLDPSNETYLLNPEWGFSVRPIRSKEVKWWINGYLYKKFKRSLSDQILRQVVGTLEAKAYSEGSIGQVYIRSAVVADKLYYDLGDGANVVEVMAGKGWKVTDKCPVKFRRLPHQLSQVRPTAEGDINLALKYVNLKTDWEKLLFLTYLVVAFIEHILRPAISIYGDQGSGKTLLARIIRSIVDPNIAGVISPPKDEAELFQQANQNYCVFIDNVSYLSKDTSDALCRLITGASYSKRQLYSDSDIITYSQRVLVGLTGISQVATESDLLDRNLLFHLERINSAKRIGEEELWNSFNNDLPAILGGIFSVLSGVLKNAASVTLSNTPRMADYGRYAAAAAIELGYDVEEFEEALRNNALRQNQVALSGSAVARCLIRFMKDRNDWEGSSSELYLKLSEIAKKEGSAFGGTFGFPKDANWLWRRIISVRPNLNAIGIYPEHDEVSANSLIRIERRLAQIPNGSMAALAADSSISDESIKEGGNMSA